MAEKYVPSPEEMQKAEEMMTPEQKFLSRFREETEEAYQKIIENQKREKAKAKSAREEAMKYAKRKLIEIETEREAKRREIAAEHTGWSEEEVEKELEKREDIQQAEVQMTKKQKELSQAREEGYNIAKSQAKNTQK